MKLPSFAFAAALILAGCSDNTNQPTTATATNSSSPLNAPADYLRAAAKGQQNAVSTIDTVSLDSAVQRFNVDQGRNPTDLNELVQKKYIAQIPAPPHGMKIVYDANSGKVSVEKQ